MIYGWIIGRLVALGLGIKSAVEGQEDETFPRKLPLAKGLMKLHKNHNGGFPSGFTRERPGSVKGVPLMIVSAMMGALAAMIQDESRTGEKLGLSPVMEGTLNNLYDRVMCGYVVDYFTIEWKSFRKAVFNLGDMFVFLGSVVSVLAQAVKSLEEVGVKKKKK